MIEQPLSPLDHLHHLSAEARAEVVWWCAWHRAWDYCAARGLCDGWGSHEYRRLTARAAQAGLKPSQAEMRTWIGRQSVADANPNPSTEDSNRDQP